MALFMQHQAALVLDGDVSSPDAQHVVACAAAAGIRVVDQFPPLRAIARAQPQALAEYYNVNEGELVGHMTAKGNEHAAAMLASALREWLAAAPPARPNPEPARPAR
jgi:hypothetical protein